MKKKYWIWGLGIGIIVAGILLGIAAFTMLKPTRLTIDVAPIHSVNYNNYIQDNQLDYKGNLLGWASRSPFGGAKMTLHSGNGDSSVLSGITAPFQLLENRIVYVKNGNLLLRNLNSRQSSRIAKNVSSFLATEEYILYLAENVLFQYDWNTDKAVTLGENVYQFLLHQDAIYAVDFEGNLMRLEAEGTWSTLYTMQDVNFPFCVMSHGNALVYVRNNEVRYIDLSTGKVDAVCLTEGTYANNRINFICDDKQLFVSFQATKTDGSIVKNIDYADNGLWRIDSETKEKVKLTTEVFDQLYLFDGRLLFGQTGNTLYQIHIDSGEVTQISS